MNRKSLCSASSDHPLETISPLNIDMYDSYISLLFSFLVGCKRCSSGFYDFYGHPRGVTQRNSVLDGGSEILIVHLLPMFRETKTVGFFSQ